MLTLRFPCKRHAATIFLVLFAAATAVGQPPRSLELSRPVRSWEFLPVVGQRAALFGSEAGTFEAWVYPLKLLRNFHLNFILPNQTLSADTLARTVIVRPESATIVYAYETFSVRETFLVPVHEPGAVISFEVTTAHPLEIEAIFERDFQLEWPAALGATYINWDANLHAFSFGEEQKKYAVLVGSPTGTVSQIEYATNYATVPDNRLRLGVTEKGTDTKLLIVAASSQGQKEAGDTYRHLAADYDQLRRDSAKYYADYLEHTVNLDLPDKQLQQAYDWSRISTLQGLVDNSDLGKGLIAGYRTSGFSQRPGFAWFFGRDSMWTSLALTANDDFATSRAAIDFISKFQRDDGKIPHEIAQTAALVDWFKKYPYPYASADATPLFMIATDDYVTRSGDTAFAKEKWDTLWKAYEFLRSTYDSRGFPQNLGVGHGWVEGGPLLPVKAELYQVGLGAAALRSLSHLASLIGKNDDAARLSQEFDQQRKLLNDLFWSEEKSLYAFALDVNGNRIDTPSVLASVPLWFDLLDSDKAQRMINVLSAPDHQTDWGMRIISSTNPLYNPGGYHFGSVWPLFTGWASVGEYRYHRAFPAYANLRANSLLALDGSLGHATEVLSGDFYEPLSTSSPHQIWSAAMVLSPILRGLLGFDVDSNTHLLTFRPHVPTDWTSFSVNGVHVGQVTLDLTYKRSADEVDLEVRRSGDGSVAMDFAPALSPRARVTQAELEGRTLAAKLESYDSDQHVLVHFTVNRPTMRLRIKTRNDFGLVLNSALPALGAASHGLRVVSESWSSSKDTLTLNLAGVPGNDYDLGIWNPGEITSAEGAELVSRDNVVKLLIRFAPADISGYVQRQVTLHFKPRAH